MTEGAGYSLSDIASIMGSNKDNGSWLLIVLFLFVFMGFGRGFGGGAPMGANFATSNEVQRGFDNQNSMANQREILSAITSGTAEQVAATNQTFHDTWNMLSDKYSEITRDVGNLSALVQSGIANSNQCCNNVIRAIDSVKYDNLQNTAATNANTTAQIQKVLDSLAQNKIDALQGRVNQLELQQATNGVVRYPNGWTYNAGTSPFCGGCNCGVMG